MKIAFIYGKLPGVKSGEAYPYEVPTDAEINAEGWNKASGAAFSRADLPTTGA